MRNQMKEKNMSGIFSQKNPSEPMNYRTVSPITRISMHLLDLGVKLSLLDSILKQVRQLM